MDELIERAHRGDASEAELERLATWRAADPGNERHYREVCRILAATAALRAELTAAGPPPAAAELIARYERSPAPVEAAPRPMQQPPSMRPGWGSRRLRRSAPWAVAALSVVLLALSLVYPTEEATVAVAAAPMEVVTGAGEIATVQLGDGSVVRLAPSSRLRVGEHGDPRAVSLDGRAFFSVAKAEGRQFRVHTRAGTAVVLGTRFEIETEDEELRLVVVEGRVALEAPENRVEVGAGEASSVSNRLAAQPTLVSDVEGMLQWTGRFLAFQSTPLREVAREISSTYGVEVTITDSALARRTVTSVFTGQSLDSVLDVVCTVVNAHCVVRANEVTMSPR